MIISDFLNRFVTLAVAVFFFVDLFFSRTRAIAVEVVDDVVFNDAIDVIVVRLLRRDVTNQFKVVSNKNSSRSNDFPSGLYQLYSQKKTLTCQGE